VAKLLLIEDEVGVQNYFKTVVTRMGHTFIAASDGPAGLQALTPEAGIDLIMTDLNMPGARHSQADARHAGCGGVRVSDAGTS